MRFKDQPDGKCMECVWNRSTDDDVNCAVPNTHLTNLICIQKRIMVMNQNIAYDFEEFEDDGDEWKNS